MRGLIKLATDATFRQVYAGRRSRLAFDHEFVSFSVGNERFAIEIRNLREIVPVRSLTAVPRVPSFILGIFSVRGVIVPVIDLAQRIGVRSSESERHARILIADCDGEPLGLLVDRVWGVRRMLDKEVESAPLPGGFDTRFLSGVARRDDEMMVILNLSVVADFRVDGNG